MGSGMGEVIDNIYEKYLLRDFVGKIIPGLTFLLSVYISIKQKGLLNNFTDEAFDNKLFWVFIIGFSWVIAFAIQSLGEIFRLIRYYDKKIYKDDNGWYKAYNKFYRTAAVNEKNTIERCVVIKEACGNLSVSLIASAIFSSIIIFSNNTKLTSGIILVVIILSLIRMHGVHAKRQTKYLKSVIEKE